MPVSSQTMPANLADAAAKTGRFKTSLAAAAKAEIIEMLKTGGPFTLFAPTDEAFSKFPTNTISRLMQLENRALLRSILTYHFAIGKVMSPRFCGKRYRAKTVEGSELRIDGAMAEGAVRVNGAHIVWPDIAASNGVLHGIGGVLRPRPVAKKHEGSDRAHFRDEVGVSS